MIRKKNFLVALFVATATFFTACSDDDDGGTPPVIAPTGSIEVDDQTVVNGTVTVNNVEISDDGWIVIYRDNAGVIGSEILGYHHIDDGEQENVVVDLNDDIEVTNGEMLWAGLHVDSNDDGEFDWDGTTGVDVPVGSGAMQVADSFTVTVDEPNSVTAGDQAVSENSITVDNVTMEEAGWLVVHADNEGAPGEVIGISDVISAGSHDNVIVTFNDSADVNVGDTLWLMLHSDTGVAGEYEFDGENGLDLPVMGSDDTPVMISITVTE